MRTNPEIPAARAEITAIAFSFLLVVASTLAGLLWH
jgi:hypothetical protein